MAIFSVSKVTLMAALILFSLSSNSNTFTGAAPVSTSIIARNVNGDLHPHIGAHSSTQSATNVHIRNSKRWTALYSRGDKDKGGKNKNGKSKGGSSTTESGVRAQAVVSSSTEVSVRSL